MLTCGSASIHSSSVLLDQLLQLSRRIHMIFKYAKTNLHIKSHLNQFSVCALVQCSFLTIQSSIFLATQYLRTESLRHLGLVLLCLYDVCFRLFTWFQGHLFFLYLLVPQLSYFHVSYSLWCFYLLACVLVMDSFRMSSRYSV